VFGAQRLAEAKMLPNAVVRDPHKQPFASIYGSTGLASPIRGKLDHVRVTVSLVYARGSAGAGQLMLIWRLCDDSYAERNAVGLIHDPPAAAVDARRIAGNPI
jgi:hypothetical protein